MKRFELCVSALELSVYNLQPGDFKRKCDVHTAVDELVVSLTRRQFCSFHPLRQSRTQGFGNIKEHRIDSMRCFLTVRFGLEPVIVTLPKGRCHQK